MAQTTLWSLLSVGNRSFGGSGYDTLEEKKQSHEAADKVPGLGIVLYQYPIPMEETVGKGMALWMRARTSEVPQGPRNTAGVCRVIGFCERGGLGVGEGSSMV